MHILAAFKVGRGAYGSPRVHDELKAAGIAVSRKRVARILRELGLEGRRKRRFKTTTDSKQLADFEHVCDEARRNVAGERGAVSVQGLREVPQFCVARLEYPTTSFIRREPAAHSCQSLARQPTCRSTYEHVGVLTYMGTCTRIPRILASPARFRAPEGSQGQARPGFDWLGQR